MSSTYILTTRQNEVALGPSEGRGHIDGLPTPKSLVDMLPGVLQEDDFCARFVDALDEVMAPVFATLDCLDSYLDPLLAPPDFVEWLASWVGIEVDETWDPARRRSLVRNAVVLYRNRGTASGLAAHIQLYTGVTPQIEDSGGCIWSQTAETAFPGAAKPSLTVRVHVDDDEGLRLATLSRIVAASRPAHVPYLVELSEGGSGVQVSDEASAESGADGAPSAIVLPGSEQIELAPQAPPAAEEEEARGDDSPGPPGPDAS